MSRFEYDALGRPLEQRQRKTYSYDPFGQRVGLDNDPGPGATSGSANATAGEFTYGYNAHGSVTLLIDEQDGGVQASYGYEPTASPSTSSPRKTQPASPPPAS